MGKKKKNNQEESIENTETQVKDAENNAHQDSEAKAKNPDDKTNDDKQDHQDSKTEEKDPIQELESKYNELNDKYLRLYSDFDNFRKRTIKEKGELISSASGEIMKDLLAVLDDFERALESNATSEDPANMKEGFELIYNKFKNILTSKGLEPMDSKGKPFDLDHHEAVTNIPAQEEEDKGKVMDVIEKGYFLNDKVLRYAKVVVGQ
ncbi:MAG: nucleotide exchange factor GrpE [Bacteroidota bacterium]